MLIHNTVGITREAGHGDVAGLLIMRAIDLTVTRMVTYPLAQRSSPLQRLGSGLETLVALGWLEFAIVPVAYGDDMILESQLYGDKGIKDDQLSFLVVLRHS